MKIKLGHHILSWNAVGDRDADLDASVCRLHDRVGSEGRRDEDDGGFRVGLGNCILDGIKDWQAKVRAAPLAGSDTAHHVGAIIDHILSVEGADLSGEALDDDAGILMNMNGHAVWAPVDDALAMN